MSLLLISILLFITLRRKQEEIFKNCLLNILFRSDIIPIQCLDSGFRIIDSFLFLRKRTPRKQNNEKKPLY
jgi:hypothetical protein